MRYISICGRYMWTTHRGADRGAERGAERGALTWIIICPWYTDTSVLLAMRAEESQHMHEYNTSTYACMHVGHMAITHRVAVATRILLLPRYTDTSFLSALPAEESKHMCG